MLSWGDVRWALRSLRRSPSFTVTSILLVAVGVGAVTTVFTLIDHVLLRPPPYPDPDELFVTTQGPQTGPAFRRLQTMLTVAEWAGAWVDDVNLAGPEEPLRLREARVTEGFLSILGARAARGRLLEADDYNTAQSVVLSAEAWRRVWGEDPSIIGAALDVDGTPMTVVGVLDVTFVPPEAVVGNGVDLWRPVDWTSEAMTSDDYHVLGVVGRRLAGAPLGAVQSEFREVVASTAPTHGHEAREAGHGGPPRVLGLAEATVAGVRVGLGLLLAAVVLLLLVACANVANLVLAQGLARRQEMAIRRVMGARTSSLVRLLLVETLAVGLAGGLAGAALAWGGVHAFTTLNPRPLPGQIALAIDGRTFLFAAALTIVTSILFGLLPALQSLSAGLAPALRGGIATVTPSRRTTRARNALVALEVALSFVLVTTAGLLGRSFLAVRTQDPGFETASLWTVPLTLPEFETPDQFATLMTGILEATTRTPGVAGAAYGSTMPLEMTGGGRCCWQTRLRGEEDGGSELPAVVHPVSDGYFTTLGIRTVTGRTWRKEEIGADPIPVVVNVSLAREIYGMPEATVGRSLSVSRMKLSIVGVVGDTKHYGLDQDHGPAVYVPIERMPFADTRAHLVAKAVSGAASSMPGALRAAVWSVAPRLPVPTVRSMGTWLSASTSSRRFDSAVFAAFAGAALLLAAGGLYGVLLHTAMQRRWEMGLRWALGASRWDLRRQMLLEGARLGMTGLVMGVGGAWLTSRLLRSRIWGVGTDDPLTWAGAIVLVLLATLAASWLPACRAAHTDPVEALRDH